MKIYQHYILVAVTALALGLTGCGGGSGSVGSNAGGNAAAGGTGASGGGGGNNPPQQDAGCNPPTDAQMPATPGPGQSRAGLSCAIHIPAPGLPGEVVAFQVFEPSTLSGDQSYPVILEGHGFSASRQTSSDNPGIPGLSAPIGALRDADYGIISIDQAGHGETGGQIQLMDPDQEGLFLLAILDWIDANLDWAAQGPDLDAGENNILLGSIGPSYGGGYQHLIHAIDPQKRLDAMVPQITWTDLYYSLIPNSVIKALWDTALFGLGQQAGGGGNFDPYVTNNFLAGFQANQISDDFQDYLRYHGLDYFCDGVAVATNGGPGTMPNFGDPVPAPTAVHALYFQGFRDVLFNFNEAWINYECLNNLGGDVRLLTYQGGHNSIPVVQDPGALINQPSGIGDFNCGNINADAATIAFFDEHLKGIAGAADAVLNNTEICYSLSPGDAVFVNSVISGTAGTAFPVPSSTFVAGVQAIPLPVPLYTAPASGDVIAGVPYLDIELTDTVGGVILDPDNVIIFVGIGHMRTNQPGVWELADNQVLPLRGLGTHQVDMVGIGDRLAPGDQVALLLYGLNDQYVATGGVNQANPVIGLVSVTGDIHLPLIGP